jgi:hypothetical protein
MPSLFILNTHRQLVVVNPSGVNFAHWPIHISRIAMLLRIIAVRDAWPRVDTADGAFDWELQEFIVLLLCILLCIAVFRVGRNDAPSGW